MAQSIPEANRVGDAAILRRNRIAMLIWSRLDLRNQRGEMLFWPPVVMACWAPRSLFWL